MKVNFKELKNVTKQLNESKKTKIKFVGVTSERLLQDFLDTCADFDIDELPEQVKNFYNTVNQTSEETTEETTPEPVKEKKVKEKKEKTDTLEVKEYIKSDYINAAKELMESLSIENEDGTPAIEIEGKVKIKYLKEKLFEVFTSCTDAGISLEDEGVTKETQNLLDFIFKEKTENETVEEKQLRHVKEVLEKEVLEKEEKKNDKKGKENKDKKVEKNKKLDKVKKYSRLTSVLETLRGIKNPFTLEDIQEQSDKLYCKNTNSAEYDKESKKMHPATHLVNYMVSALVYFGVVVKKEDTYKMSK